MKLKIRTLISCLLSVFIGACTAVPVTDIESIVTETQLNPNVSLPLDLDVVHFIPDEEFNRIYTHVDNRGESFWYVGPQFKKAMDLVFPSYFKTVNKLAPQSTFELMFKLKTVQEYDSFMGNCLVHLDMEVLDSSGVKIFSSKVKSSSPSSAYADITCFLNSYAKSIEESLIQFINTVQPSGDQFQITSEPFYKADNYEKYFTDPKPHSSGTGFYINGKGQVLTAAHVINECFMVEVKNGESKAKSEVLKVSRILDLAVLETNQAVSSYLSVAADDLKNSDLGESIKAVGYPLSGILSDNPSLTVGNISSIGGLKGDKTNFQFTAPIQPGNSGGPVIDQQGQVLGVVSSTLNQAMMLRSSGSVSQNVNFAVKTNYIKKFLGDISYETSQHHSKQDAIDNTVQVICYK